MIIIVTLYLHQVWFIRDTIKYLQSGPLCHFEMFHWQLGRYTNCRAAPLVSGTSKRKHNITSQMSGRPTLYSSPIPSSLPSEFRRAHFATAPVDRAMNASSVDGAADTLRGAFNSGATQPRSHLTVARRDLLAKPHATFRGGRRSSWLLDGDRQIFRL